MEGDGQSQKDAEMRNRSGGRADTVEPNVKKIGRKA